MSQITCLEPPPQKVDRLAVWLKNYGNMEAVISVSYFLSILKPERFHFQH